MHLGSPFPTPQKADEHLLWHSCFEWGSLLSIPGACTWIPTTKSMTSSSFMWWCSHDVRCFRWQHLCQYWRGMKGRMHKREGFLALISQSKDPYLKCTPVHPSTEFARNFYKKGENYVFSLLFSLWSCVSMQSDFGLHQFLCLGDHQDSAPSSQR